MTMTPANEKITRPEDTSYEIKIQVELIKNLYQQWRSVLLGVITTATGIAFIFHDDVPDNIILGWLLNVYFLSFLRHLSVKHFNAHVYEPADIIKWGWVFAFFAFLSGLVWGSASFVFFTPDNLQLFNVLSLIIIAMSVGSLGALSSFPTAYYIFVLPAMLPIIWRYMNIDETGYNIFGSLMLVFIFALFSFSRVNYRMLRESVELRFQNVELIEQLTEQKNVAEQANIAKTKFLAAASHDLRQPLHAIGLFLGVLAEKIEKNDQKIIVEKIQKSSDALNSLLDSLLDVSKLDAGIITINRQPFSLNSLFDSLKNEFEPYSREKNLRLTFVNTRLWINSDFGIIERVVRNLISNAIRYTRQGGIVVGCRRYQGNILLAVYDTGIGIEKCKMGEIFNEFYQVDNPERDRSKGLGLGLAIVKRMTQLLGKTVISLSIPGKGSMFGLLIPAEAITIPIDEIEYAGSPLQEVSFENKIALVVDDEAEIRDSLSELLRSWHCQVIAVASGHEAINVLRAKDILPNIILADYRLRNDETGNDVIASVQALYDEPVPAIIITGDTAPDRIIEANTGGSEILHKPVLPNELRLLIEKLFSK